MKYLEGGTTVEVFKGPLNGLAIAFNLILWFFEKTGFFGLLGGVLANFLATPSQEAKKSSIFKK